MKNSDQGSSRPLGDDEYDQEGWPLEALSISRHSYSLALGQDSCWLAQFKELPGYYGEGATIGQALERLRQSLGERPHFRIHHKFRSTRQLEAAIRRKYNARAVAALTRADGLGYNLGGGPGVDASAKARGIGKTVVNEARAELAKALRARDGRLTAGVNKRALQETARAADERAIVELRAAAETPWRLEHAAARAKFPTKKRRISAKVPVSRNSSP
jgi:hypothetical protein